MDYENNKDKNFILNSASKEKGGIEHRIGFYYGVNRNGEFIIEGVIKPDVDFDYFDKLTREEKQNLLIK